MSLILTNLGKFSLVLIIFMDVWSFVVGAISLNTSNSSSGEKSFAVLVPALAKR